MPYAWLVYLAFYVVSVALSRPSWPAMAGHGAVVVLFLVFYFRAWIDRGPAALGDIAGMVALGVAVAPFTPASSTFFIYASAFVGHAGSRERTIQVAVAVIGAAVLTGLVVQRSPAFWIPAVLVSAVVSASSYHTASIAEANAQLRVAQADVAHFARVAERERIARDLHDLLGHTLTVIRMKAQLASRVGQADPARALSEVGDIERIAGDALNDVRDAVSAYRGAQVVEHALETAAQTLATAGVQATITRPAFPLSSRHELVFALAIREAVTNVVRHARASSCSIDVLGDGARVVLRVRDDGVGNHGPDGSGLWGMRTRARECGGTVEIAHSRGTLVEVSLPVANRADAASGVPA
jgi:two-component system sensor histidine kinase DesK